MEGEIPPGLLTSEEQQRYMTLQSLFRHPGWDILVREISESIERAPTDAFWKAKTFDDVVAERVRCQERTVLIRYPDLVESRTQQIIANRAQQAARQMEDDSE